MTTNRDVAYSKFMQKRPTKAYYQTRGQTGTGAELRDLRKVSDDLAGMVESRLSPDSMTYPRLTSLNFDDVTAAGKTAQKVRHNGIPTGYEKASKSWLYTVGKTIYVTAVKPGELGNEVLVTWASGGAAAVSVVGTVVTLTIKNDGTTTPAALQTLIDANSKLRQLVAITSTDATAIPNAFVALTTALTPLAGGTGLGLGCEMQGAWGSTTNILFVAPKLGTASARYQIKWVSGAALAVTADRKSCTITFVDGVTTYAQVAAAVNAHGIAKEHVYAMLPGDGSGAVTGLDAKQPTMTTDFGTALFVGSTLAIVYAISTTEVTFDYAALAEAAGDTVPVELRMGLVNYGWISAIVV